MQARDHGVEQLVDRQREGRVGLAVAGLGELLGEATGISPRCIELREPQLDICSEQLDVRTPGGPFGCFEQREHGRVAADRIEQEILDRRHALARDPERVQIGLIRHASAQAPFDAARPRRPKIDRGVELLLGERSERQRPNPLPRLTQLHPRGLAVVERPARWRRTKPRHGLAQRLRVRVRLLEIDEHCLPDIGEHLGTVIDLRLRAPDSERAENRETTDDSPTLHSDSKKRSSAARSVASASTNACFAASASPPCHSTASAKFRARPSCR